MKIYYNKLVRDRIPEIIKSTGKIFSTEIMSDEEYRISLFNKLLEEVQELLLASPENYAMEIADIKEVLNTIIAILNIDSLELDKLQEQKRGKRGGFEEKIKLIWVEEPGIRNNDGVNRFGAN